MTNEQRILVGMDPSELTLGSTPTIHTSYSQLSEYMRCSFKYYLHRIKGMRGKGSLAMSAGTAGHAAVEKNYRRKIITTTDIPREEFLDFASDSYDAETHLLSKDELKPGEDIGRNKDAHIQLLRYYHQAEAPKIKPIAVELAFNIDIPASEDYEYPIRIVEGRIDLVAPDILDNKFSGRAKQQGEVDLTDQLTMYDLAFAQHGIEVPGLGFEVFLQANTRDGPRVQHLRRGPDFMKPAVRQARRDRLVHKLRTVQRAIDQGIFIPADDPKVCGYCDFRETCQFSLVKDDYTALAIQQKGP